MSRVIWAVLGRCLDAEQKNKQTESRHHPRQKGQRTLTAADISQGKLGFGSTGTAPRPLAPSVHFIETNSVPIVIS